MKYNEEVKYNQIHQVSKIDPKVNLEKILTFSPDRFMGEKRSQIVLSTWEAVDQFRAEQAARSKKMVRGRVKEGKPRPR